MEAVVSAAGVEVTAVVGDAVRADTTAVVAVMVVVVVVMEVVATVVAVTVKVATVVDPGTPGAAVPPKEAGGISLGLGRRFTSLFAY